MKLAHNSKKTILLKITGQALKIESGSIDVDILKDIITQIKALSHEYYFNIVIGGGNILRGAQLKNISTISAHYAGMLATMINGLIIQDLFNQFDIKNYLLSAIECKLGLPISAESIFRAKSESACMIFVCGTGLPYFTSDTNAVLRALEINADELWKGTKVDGIYNKDPKEFRDAKLLKRVTYNFLIENNLKIMDTTAYLLAKEHNLRIRIFDIFNKNSILEAASNNCFGSTINN